MKRLQSLLGCALATGLMTVATANVHAGGFVINNVVYASINITARGTLEVDGKHKSVSVTEKDILSALGLSDDTALAVDTSTGDVWSIDSKTKTLGEDLTTSGSFTVTVDQAGSSTKGDTTTETGTVEVQIYSDPQFVSGVLNEADSEADSSEWMVLDGDYKLVKSESAPNKKGFETINDKFSTTDLTGNAHDDGETADVTGDLSASGSGSVD